MGLMVTALLAVPISLVSPKFFQYLVDVVMRSHRPEQFYIVVLGLLFVYVSRLLCDSFSLLCSNRILNAFTYHIRKDVLQKLERVPFRFLEKQPAGELKMRLMDDVDSLGNFIKEQVAEYLSSILNASFATIIVILIHPKTAVYCMIILPPIFLLEYLVGKSVKKVNEDIRRVNGKYNTFTHESLQFWREIKVHHVENAFIARYQDFRNQLARLGMRYIRYWACQEVFKDLKTNYLTKILVYIIGAVFVIRSELTVGNLIMLAEYFTMLFTALDTINTKRVTLKTNEPYYNRVFDTLHFPEESLSVQTEHSFEDEIQTTQLSFFYDQQTTVLRSIDATIKKGDYIAIIGKTGCGKTTLLKLLIGLYSPTKGTVLYDDNPLQNIDRNSLYQKIGIVMQDNYLFNMSIRDNLLLANPFATEQDLMEACQKANIYDFIVSLPDGFSTFIGERGVKLSGGQKQRLTIAAALLKNPEILIFDEATSSLDKQSEDIINEAICEIAKQVTVIVITHKPVTAMRAEKILVIDEGRVQAYGTHQELLKENLYYQKLVEAAYENK